MYKDVVDYILQFSLFYGIIWWPNPYTMPQMQTSNQELNYSLHHGRILFHECSTSSGKARVEGFQWVTVQLKDTLHHKMITWSKTFSSKFLPLSEDIYLSNKNTCFFMTVSPRYTVWFLAPSQAGLGSISGVGTVIQTVHSSGVSLVAMSWQMGNRCWILQNVYHADP